ncbi:HIT family protein [Chromobacterium amazonense]|uniref:HIT family protein n=1 Tax=Chromobacterium amazonense TaxID=1382803 RepID=UPI00237DDDD6|nr:HIT family protein [Chromobacterium amazonense]MDE1715407.1 HIT family protein [Chromobacterium amazonense]
MPIQADCPFCAIAAQAEHPAVMHQNEDWLCLPPLQQEAPGHTLLVSREHYASLQDAPAAIGAGLIGACQWLNRHFALALQSDGFNLLNANGDAAQQSVPHLHLHFLPRRIRDGINAWPKLPGTKNSIEPLPAKEA